MKYTVVQTPRGAKDILPREAYVKSRLEQRAAAYLESWGYARVYTPTFEFFDAIAQGDGPVLADSLYRFVDRDGAALALRPDDDHPHRPDGGHPLPAGGHAPAPLLCR